MFLSFVASLEVMAQYDAHFSHYWAMESSFNPAAVGKTDKVNVVAAYSMSLTGYESSPKTMFAVQSCVSEFFHLDLFPSNCTFL